VQATKIVSVLETYITKESFYCGGISVNTAALPAKTLLKWR